MEAGVLKQDDSSTVATMVWAASHGIVSLYLGGLLSVPRDEFPAYFQSTIMRLFTGIGGPAFSIGNHAPAPSAVFSPLPVPN